MHTTTYITTPSTDEIEAAWFELMQGELGLDRRDCLREFMQGMVDHLRDEARYGVPILDSDGEPLRAVSSLEVARRVVRAYAALIYG